MSVLGGYPALTSSVTGVRYGRPIGHIVMGCRELGYIVSGYQGLGRMS
jgi:hypothetical protein